jgi:glycosyltransferase involved in cell wall biosynthesis
MNSLINEYQKVPVKEYPNKLKDKPLVSVLVQTFQHVDYIKQCLDGILMQKTNFGFEIMLGEDASSDGTREICIEFAKKHSDKIRLFLHDRKNVIYISGRATGRFNLFYNIHKARGKYFALCEGDDYWIDPLKLQKQVDFLEANPDFAICFHPIKIEKDGTLINDYITHEVPDTTDIYDLTNKSNYIHTPSVVFRNYLTDFPNALFKSVIGDYMIYMYIAQYGKIRKLKDTSAVYRVHEGGIWSNLDSIDKRERSKNTFKYLISFISDAKVINILKKKHITSNLKFFFLLSIKKRKIEISILKDCFEFGFLLFFKAIFEKIIK